jgi:hypothetical protein
LDRFCFYCQISGKRRNFYFYTGESKQSLPAFLGATPAFLIFFTPNFLMINKESIFCIARGDGGGV